MVCFVTFFLVVGLVVCLLLWDVVLAGNVLGVLDGGLLD